VHLLGRLGVLLCRVADAVDRRRRSDPTPDDPWRGLYLPDEQVDRLLIADPTQRIGFAAGSDPAAALAERVEAFADAAETAGAEIRLRQLQRRMQLSGVEVEVLITVLGPELDRRFEQLFGYLNDDITRRRATTGLALELAGLDPRGPEARWCLGAGSTLVRRGLVVVDEPDRPWLGRSLRVPDRVAAWCVGDDWPDTDLVGLIDPLPGVEPMSGGAVLVPPLPGALPVTPAADAVVAGLRRALLTRRVPAYVREEPGSSGRQIGCLVWAAVGRPSLVCRLDRLDPDADIVTVAAALAREAMLTGAGLVVGPVEALARRGSHAVQVFADGPAAIVLHGRGAWDPSWSAAVPVTALAPAPAASEMASYWRAGLRSVETVPGLDAAAATEQFRLEPEQVARSVTAASLQALVDGRPVDVEHVRAGARVQGSVGLQRLARRIEPAVGWDDLVLPRPVAGQLRGLAGRARHRDTVLGEWGMRPGGGRGRGVVALFAGQSGTGKTMSAEVLAGDLGMDLYAVNLATVVDKYVGETEKNLERIFSEAEGVSAVLLFDEADALFGKRSEVRDANDRYANIEVAYLLQQMERFDGLAVLSTNLRANIDEAFVRRLDAIVDFPMPDAAHRTALWDRCLAPGVPRADDLDLAFCGKAFELSGGSIRSIALSAAYAAAEAGQPVSMADLVRCIEQEYRKLGRLCNEAEFGPYWHLLDR